jgi:hypothetical protein
MFVTCLHAAYPVESRTACIPGNAQPPTAVEEARQTQVVDQPESFGHYYPATWVEQGTEAGKRRVCRILHEYATGQKWLFTLYPAILDHQRALTAEHTYF